MEDDIDNKLKIVNSQMANLIIKKNNTMELKDFIENFAAQFDDTDASEFKPETKFRDLEEWSSLVALSLIAMIDEEYNIALKGDDIRNSNTIEELYNTVKSKI